MEAENSDDIWEYEINALICPPGQNIFNRGVLLTFTTDEHSKRAISLDDKSILNLKSRFDETDQENILNNMLCDVYNGSFKYTTLDSKTNYFRGMTQKVCVYNKSYNIFFYVIRQYKREYIGTSKFILEISKMDSLTNDKCPVYIRPIEVQFYINSVGEIIYEVNNDASLLNIDLKDYVNEQIHSHVDNYLKFLQARESYERDIRDIQWRQSTLLYMNYTSGRLFELPRNLRHSIMIYITCEPILNDKYIEIFNLNQNMKVGEKQLWKIKN